MSSKLVIVNGIVNDEHLPRVEINMDDGSMIDMDAQDATNLALLILRVAEQIKADASLVQWALNMAPEKPNIAGSMMDSLRELRNRLDIDARNRQEEF